MPNKGKKSKDKSFKDLDDKLRIPHQLKQLDLLLDELSLLIESIKTERGKDEKV